MFNITVHPQHVDRHGHQRVDDVESIEGSVSVYEGWDARDAAIPANSN
jgi:hypothetical protein